MAARIFAWALVVAAVAGALAVAAFALWIALILIPVVVVAGVIAWLAFRYQMWRVGTRVRAAGFLAVVGMTPAVGSAELRADLVILDDQPDRLHFDLLPDVAFGVRIVRDDRIQFVAVGAVHQQDGADRLLRVVE